MRHIHTSIASRHQATRGNNKILRTPLPHTISSEERLPRLTRRTLAQLITNTSPFLKSCCLKVDAKTHPSPLCPLCGIHTHDTHHLFNCTHIRTTLSPLNLWTDPAGVTALLTRWTEKLTGEPQAGTTDSPLLARVMGMGRQQQHYYFITINIIILTIIFIIIIITITIFTILINITIITICTIITIFTIIYYYYYFITIIIVTISIITIMTVFTIIYYFYYYYFYYNYYYYYSYYIETQQIINITAFRITIGSHFVLKPSIIDVTVPSIEIWREFEV